MMKYFTLLILSLLAGCNSKDFPVQACEDASRVPLVGSILQGASSLKEVEYVERKHKGRDYVAFSAKITKDPTELLKKNAIHLTDVPGKDISSFVKTLSPKIASDFDFEGGLSGSGIIDGTSFWIAFAADENLSECIVYCYKSTGR